MREIKFRGKRIDNGEWIYGEKLTRNNKTFIIPIEDDEDVITIGATRLLIYTFEEVDPKTVGQYTGLKDKNEKEIYEGDVVQIKDDWDEYGWKAGLVGNIIFKDFFFGISLASEQKPGTRYTVYMEVNKGKDVEVIGNIYENPNLIK